MRFVMRPFAFAFLLLLDANSLAAAQQKQPDPDNPEDSLTEADLLKPQVELETGGHTARIMKLFFTGDGKQIVTISRDQTIRYWDAETGEPRRVLRLQYYMDMLGIEYAAALTPDRKTLAVYGWRLPVGKQRRIVFVDVEQGRIDHVQDLPLSGIPPICLAFSPDRKMLALSAGTAFRSSAVVWDLDPKKKVLDVKLDRTGESKNDGGARSMAFAPDGKRLAVGTANRVYVVSVPSGKVEATLDDLAVGPLRALDWAPKEPVLAIGGRGKVILWDAEKKQTIRTLNRAKTLSLSWSPDGRQLLRTCHTDSNPYVELLDATSGQLVQGITVDGYQPVLNAAAFAPDGKRVAFAGGNHDSVTLWDLEAKKSLWTRRGLGGPVVACGWSSDGKTIYYGQEAKDLARRPRDRQLNFALDFADLELLRRGHSTYFDPKKIQRQVFERDGTTLSMDGPPILYRAGETFTLPKGGGPNDGRTLIAGNRVAMESAGPIRLFDLGRKSTGKLYGHSDVVQELAPSPDGKLLLSASLDQTLKVWNVEKQGHEKLLLTLFFAGPDWIVWTPEGYYAATPGGEKLMGWSIFHGFDKLKSFYPAERFHKRLYRPDIIKLVLEKGNIAEAVAAADAARGQKETRSVKIDDLLPPRVVLTVVDETKKPFVKLKVKAEASGKNQPIKSLRLMLNGRLVPGNKTFAEYAAGTPKAEVEWTFQLPEGEHSLAVLARSEDSSSKSEPLHLKFVNAKKLPTLHVLTVGINNYQDSELDLNYAAADAEVLAAAFVRHCKGQLYQDVKTKVMLNKDATTPAILKELGKLRKDAQQQDLVVVFFACHGVKEKKGYFLLTHEAQTKKLAVTSLSGDDLRRELAEFKCQVFLMLDACHAAGFGEGKRLSKLGLKPATDDVTRDLTDDDCGVAVMCAAMGYEKAEGQGGHGLFTKAVLEALEKKPGVPFNRQNQRVYVHHLQSYVFDEVSIRSKDRQHPYLSLPWIVESFVVR
jgi:WD40 repeat protein